ncbi:NAD-dependent epimerase/dehydratase family protein [Paenibacillus tarimensis]|uniref:NAD-dependent epimerase/dehydratase family protein n=1 Tax=Paenibacillus tarimensis TaxID=416012 RepID=UPI001F2CEC9C|nr:NAD(P)-dependent oxidoreductase [Paenibacillus tarimensis]MCF2944056.1 NAD(P)-dependent oxidoreductase [Paenibacillus tarimensis]
MKRKLLITGAAGVVGSAILEGLHEKDKYEIVAGDIRADEERGVIELDVTNPQRLLELTEGVDTILHIAWAKDQEDFLGKVLPINVTGAYHIYEAARKNGVKRVIFASSNHATGFYEVDEQIGATDPYRPDSFYGLSKCYIELLGRLYSDKYGVSSLNMRIGNFPGDDCPHSDRAAHIWISARDLVQLTERCIEADKDIKFLAMYGTSNNTDNYYNIDYLEELIGYKPLDNAAEVMEGAKCAGEAVKHDETEYKGGIWSEK